jgi:predicted thioesterase
MIRLRATAAFHALQQYCEGDEISVGTSVHVEHRAASGIGSWIKAEAVVESIDGRFYTMRVSAKDGLQEIARGSVGRAIVSRSEVFGSRPKTKVIAIGRAPVCIASALRNISKPQRAEKGRGGCMAALPGRIGCR